jgi:hypothetical protein
MKIKDKLINNSRTIEDGFYIGEYIELSTVLDIITESLEKQRQLCYHRFNDDGSQLNAVQAILYAPEPELD